MSFPKGVQRKSCRHLFAQPALSYPFIAEHCQQYPVATLCRVLQVSMSGYYDWHKREPSRHEREDGELARQIHRIFYAKRQVYGSPASMPSWRRKASAARKSGCLV